MRIGIIGAGHIGATLARKFGAAGHQVRIANSRGAASLAQLTAEIGASAVALDEVASGVDVLVVSVPQGRVPELPRSLFQRLPPRVVVIDTCNYYPGLRDPIIDVIEAGLPESQWVADQIGRPVIKAFNSIISMSLAENGRPPGNPGRIALPVAGDDDDARRLAIDLVDDAGFDSVDAGPLAESWRQQPGTPAYCTDLAADTLHRALAAADRDEAPSKRDAALAKLKQTPYAFTKDDIVRINRETF
jgi:8-hydroxy-5-deazaflavin:NADPH oxidoreductase